MITEQHQKLVSFYFGAVTETERLQIEQQLLLDPEVLVNYLDLKRSVENTGAIPQTPSPHIWTKLQAKMTTKRTAAWVFGFAVAAAAILLIVNLQLFFPGAESVQSQFTEVSPGKIIFDSSSELPAGSNVL